MNTLTSTLLLADSSDWLVYILPGVGSMLLVWGIYQAIAESRSSDKKRMQARLQGERRQQDKMVASILRRGASDQAKSMADKLVGKLSIVPRLQTQLDQADVDWSASQMLLNLSGVALLILVGLLAMQANFAVALCCMGAVFVVPIIGINLKRRRRMAKLANQLPDVFEMMSQALRAGHSLAGSIQTVYEQLPPPIATEFAQVYHEQNLGVKIEDALQSMATRVNSLDVRFFVTAVMIQRQTGGDLAEVLDNISGVIRGRIELAGLVRALTAEGRLSGWVLFALPALVFFASMFLNPDYASVLIDQPVGRIMLMIALGMQLMGIAMIRWIVNIKV